jgi:hypothetical protein
VPAIPTAFNGIADIVKDFVSFIIFPSSRNVILAIFMSADEFKFQSITNPTRIMRNVLIL